VLVQPIKAIRGAEVIGPSKISADNGHIITERHPACAGGKRAAGFENEAGGSQRPGQNHLARGCGRDLEQWRVCWCGYARPDGAVLRVGQTSGHLARPPRSSAGKRFSLSFGERAGGGTFFTPGGGRSINSARRSLPGSWKARFRFCACIGTMNERTGLGLRLRLRTDR